MAFDLSTAAPSAFDLSTAQPTQSGGSEIPAARRSWSDVPGEALSNLIPSAGKFARGMFEAVTSPVQTATNILDLGAGALQNITPKVVKDFVNRFDANPDAAKRAVETANAFGGEYAKRYGTVDGFKEALATDPVSVISDFSALASGGASAVSSIAPKTARVLATTAKYTNPAAPLAAAAEYGIGMGAKAAGNLVDAMQGQRPAVRAGSIIRNALTEEGRSPQNLLAAQVAIQNAAPGTTVRQALADVTTPQTQFLGEIMDARAPGAALTDRTAQEASRAARLQSVTPDMPQAIAAREQTAQALYGRARSADVMRQQLADTEIASGNALRGATGYQVPSRIAPELEALRANPVIAAAAKEAKTLAATQGLPLKDPMASLEGLHLMKIAIDNQFKNRTASTALQNYSDAALSNTKSQLLAVIEGTANQPGISPLYGAARKTYAEMSEPVNQAVVLEAMQNVLKSPTGVGERAGPFMGVMGQGQEALLKKATGAPRYTELSDVLTPSQMKVVGEVNSELMRDANIVKQTKVGAEAMKTILEANKSKFRAPDFMSVKITLANQMLSVLEGRLNKKVMAELEKGFQSGTNFSDLMKKIPASERIEVLRALGEVQGKLSPNKLNVYTQVQNALAPQDTSDAVIVTPQNRLAAP